MRFFRGRVVAEAVVGGLHKVGIAMQVVTPALVVAGQRRADPVFRVRPIAVHQHLSNVRRQQRAQRLRGADFLLGLPDFYSQRSSPPFYESAADGGIFAQDSWRIRRNLTLNYGVRWDYVTPWAEMHHQTTTLIPGVESQTFPGAPLGYLVPGDRLPNGQAIPAGIAPTPKDNFSPRIGLAYSPNWSDGFLSKVTGGPGKTSIHFGAGRFFTSPEGLTVAYPTGNPPYGLTYSSPEPPLMATPFVGALTGTQYIQQFPVNVPPYTVSPSNPDANVNWARYTPISGAGG